ncbi:Glucose transporter type 1 [Thelohanellus kitauei]|uniref:Glucose transporter type 1 n=1 Tax=Thelohanellus kitauei TaxID=669202 RepID=A0A0C2MP89_THEKT|nr:Glucose transporter type 1 [Thelohanellus kitauei]
MTLLEFLKTKKFFLATLTLLVLNMGQQLSGVNAIMAFAPSLLESAKFNHPDIGALFIALFAVVGSIIFAPFIARLQRKFLWILGFFSMTIFFILFVILQELSVNPIAGLACLCAFMFMFQIGPGPVVWFIAVEMYPPEANGAAQGVGLSLNWFANALIYLLFPIIEDVMHHRSLIIFVVIDILVMIYSIFIIVETLNKKSEQVLAEYNSKTCC